ncbi:DHH family phosphoesterase [Patescibacteria group bacterium]|nr:DHH family phosphoesterase [Patescibacteria group bacterium]MBU1448489.1 DHH family phosphoesterase [Patescibacteria group bacterium]MBU2613255.1 DHH family phosphoesterase [Patescibacteria group bacterium]
MADDRLLLTKLHDAIRNADRVLLLPHKRPDGDAAGAATALVGWLLREGKTVTAFCRDPLPDQLNFLDHAHRLTTDTTVFDVAYDLVIALDSGDLAYCGVADLLPRLPKGYLLAVIDHHAINARYGDLNIVDTDASSTCEIVFRFFETNGIRIDQAMATSLLTGILFDTGNFSNAATTPSAIAAASALLTAGARNSDIVRHMIRDKTIDMLKVWGLMLSRLHRDAASDFALTYLLESDLTDMTGETKRAVTSGFSNFLNAVTGDAGTILILQELPGGKVKGSMRSVGRDVAAVAKRLGGGGHTKAAAFMVDGRIAVTEDGPKLVGIKKDPGSERVTG